MVAASSDDKHYSGTDLRSELSRGRKMKDDQISLNLEKGRMDYKNTRERVGMEEGTQFKSNRIEYNSTIKNYNTKLSSNRIKPVVYGPSNLKYKTNRTFREKASFSREHTSKKSYKTVSGILLSRHVSNSTGIKDGDVRYKTARLNDTTASVIKDDSSQTPVSGKVFTENIILKSGKVSSVSQHLEQKPPSGHTQNISSTATNSKTDEEYTQRNRSNNSFSLFPSEISAAKNEMDFGTKTEKRNQYKLSANASDVTATSTPFALSSNSSEFPDVNNKNISLSFAIKSSYLGGESFKSNAFGYSPRNPRFSFPQTLDFVPIATHPSTASGDLILDDNLWRGRNLMEIFDGTRVSTFEVNFRFLLVSIYLPSNHKRQDQ